MKDQFLLDDSVVFLNHGSFGACPKTVFDTYQAWQREMERNPVEFLGRRSGELLFEARAALARYLNVDPGELAYIPNATTGVNIVARSLGLGQTDAILTTDHEYGACDNTWSYVAARTGATVVRTTIELPYDPAQALDAIWSQVNEKTRIISLSHITSPTALVFPVAEICRRARDSGILTLVDGAHAPGQIELDLLAIGADFYVGNCHKWMCAPKGAAFLHVRKEHHDRLDAPVISWGYSEDPNLRDALKGFTGSSLLERRFQWQGTRDIAAYLSVPAAIEFQRANHWHQIRLRCHQDACALEERVRAHTQIPRLFDATDFAQMVAIAVPERDPVMLKRRLFDDFRIEVPVTVHRENVLVRVSLQAYNDAADIAALEDALRAIYGWGP